LMQWMKRQGGGSATSSDSSSSSSSDDDEDDDKVADTSSDDVKVVDNGSSSSNSTSTSSGSSSSGSSSSSSTDSSSSSGKTRKCKVSSTKRSKKAKRSLGYAMAHPGPVRRGIYSASAAAGPHAAAHQKRSLSLSAILASREKSQKQEKRNAAPSPMGMGAIALDSPGLLGERNFVPTQAETVLKRAGEQEQAQIERRDPAVVAREVLRQSAAAARKAR